MSAYKVDIKANAKELERVAMESVQEHLAMMTNIQMQSLVAKQVDDYIKQQVAHALTTPEVSAVINSMVLNRTQAEIDKKVRALRKKLGGTP